MKSLMHSLSLAEDRSRRGVNPCGCAPSTGWRPNPGGCARLSLTREGARRPQRDEDCYRFGISPRNFTAQIGIKAGDETLSLPSRPRRQRPSLKNYLGIDCEVKRLDFKRGDQLEPEYAKLNPNKKMPTLGDDGFVLGESNAILFYMAGKHPGTATRLDITERPKRSEMPRARKTQNCGQRARSQVSPANRCGCAIPTVLALKLAKAPHLRCRSQVSR
jgi:hypothetical protein